MILAPRPPFRASRKTSRRSVSKVPAGISHDGFQGSPRGLPRQQFKGFRRRQLLRAGFRCPHPVLESQRCSSVQVPGLAARIANQPRVGRQAGKPAPGQSPPRLAPRTICGNMLHLFTLRNPASELVSEVQDYNDIRIMGAIEDRIMLSTSNLPQMDALLITTFVLPNTSETSS